MSSNYIRKKQLKIAMIGHKVVPSRRGGIELVLTTMCPKMVKRGHQVTCYNRSGDKVENEVVNKVLSYLGYLKPEVLQQIIQINIADANTIEAYTLKGTKIILGNIEDPEDLANKTNEFFYDVKTTTIPVEYIDFSYARPVLKIKQ